VLACDTVMPALCSRLSEIKLEMFALFGAPSDTSHISLSYLLRILMILSISKYNNEVLKVCFCRVTQVCYFFFLLWHFVGVVDYPCGPNLTTLYLLLTFCNVWDLPADPSFVGNNTRSEFNICCISFRIFPVIHFQPYVLSNDMSSPTFDAIFHE
jgi:hypothetical protein